MDAFKLDLNVVGIKFQCGENQLHVIEPKPMTRKPRKSHFQSFVINIVENVKFLCIGKCKYHFLGSVLLCYRCSRLYVFYCLLLY